MSWRNGKVVMVEIWWVIWWDYILYSNISGWWLSPTPLKLWFIGDISRKITMVYRWYIYILVGGWALKKKYGVEVSRDDDIPNIYGQMKNVPNISKPRIRWDKGGRHLEIYARNMFIWYKFMLENPSIFGSFSGRDMMRYDFYWFLINRLDYII